jgi:hypothetical protein
MDFSGDVTQSTKRTIIPNGTNAMIAQTGLRSAFFKRGIDRTNPTYTNVKNVTSTRSAPASCARLDGTAANKINVAAKITKTTKHRSAYCLRVSIEGNKEFAIPPSYQTRFAFVKCIPFL